MLNISGQELDETNRELITQHESRATIHGQRTLNTDH